jgi:NitT/TauT family transport system substrate-binding protein
MNTGRFTRRDMLIAGASATLAATAGFRPGPALAQGKPEKTKVMLGVGGKPLLYYLPLTIAEQLGYFKDEGLDVEINDFAGGSKALQALMGGSVDVVSGAYEHTIRMQIRGQKLVAFALMGRGMQIGLGVLKRHADKVKSPADAKGMRVGLTAPGSSTHMLATYWFVKGGVKATEFAAIGIGGSPAASVAAAEKGEIELISQPDPVISFLEQRGEVKLLVDTRTMKGNLDLFGGPMPAATLYAQPDFLKNYPGTAQALANAIVRADKWVAKATPEDVAKTVPEQYLLGDRNLYMAAFKKIQDVLSPDGLMPENGPETCLKFIAAAEPETKVDGVKLAETFTNEFVKRANEKYR